MTTTYFSATFDPAFVYGIVTRTGASFNFPGYANKQTDALLDQFVFESDQDKSASRSIRTSCTRIAEEAPILFLTNEIQRYWTQAEVPRAGAAADARDPRGGDVARVLARRLALAVPMLLGMSVIVFLIVQLVPGDPGARGARAQRDARARRAAAGPISASTSRSHVQYVNWLGDVLHRRLRAATTRAARRSADLLVAAAAGDDRAGRRGARVRGRHRHPARRARGGVAGARAGCRQPRASSMVGISVPDFWLGIMLILVFSLGAGPAALLGLGAAQPGPGREPAPRRAAGNRAGGRPRGGADPRHPGRDARRALAGLHPLLPRQGRSPSEA